MSDFTLKRKFPITANPQGTATGTLTKLGIGSDIYEIQGGGGSIIDGSTVTPTDVVATWLACAGLTETYTTLLEVLADDDVMEKLFRSENASDYLVRSTTWANDITANQTAMILIGANDYCANKLLEDSTWSTAISASTYWNEVLKGLVPVMTSNTTPSGEVFVSSQYSVSDYPIWQIFDGDDTTLGAWINAVNGYGGYKFTNAVCVNKVFVIVNSTYTDTFKIQGSNDGSTYTDILGGQFTCVSGTSAYNLNLTNNTKYQYYRILQVTKNTGSSGIGCKTLQFYGRVTKTIIYSAANDIVSFVDDEGAKVVTTDSTGKGEVTIVCKPNTDITFTSSIAKDPNNLSENYSKVVTVKTNEPVYVMPNKDVLYWYGYKSSNLENLSTANGWGGSGSYIAPTYDINKIIMATPSSGYISGVANKNAFTGINKIYAIIKGVTKVNNDYGALKGETSKALTYDGLEQATFNYDTILKVELNASRSYVCAFCVSGRTSELYAFWYNSDDDDSKAEISAIGTNEDKPTASRDYVVGEHFYKNGKFCTAKAAIASGAQFTLGTNYVEGTVADEIINTFSILNNLQTCAWSGSATLTDYSYSIQNNIPITIKKITVSSSGDAYVGVVSNVKIDIAKYAGILFRFMTPYDLSTTNKNYRRIVFVSKTQNHNPNYGGVSDMEIVVTSSRCYEDSGFASLSNIQSGEYYVGVMWLLNSNFINSVLISDICLLKK